jgi:hypothetical protein
MPKNNRKGKRMKNSEQNEKKKRDSNMHFRLYITHPTDDDI